MKINLSTGSVRPRSTDFDDRPGTFEEKHTERRETAVTYKETPDALELRMEMPGADAAGLDIRVKGRKLTVEFEKEEKTRSQDGGRERIETRTHRVTREVELPVDIDPERTDAVYRDGELRLTLGKAGGKRVKVS